VYPHHDLTGARLGQRLRADAQAVQVVERIEVVRQCAHATNW
jgi:hypothetical protein